MLYETSLKHALEQQAYILFYELGCESEAAVEVIDTEAVIRNVAKCLSKSYERYKLLIFR